MEGRHPLLGALQRTGFPDFLHRPCGSQTPEGPSQPTPRAGQEGDRPRAGTKLVHGRPWAGRPSPWQEARSSFGFGFGLILCPQRFELYPSGNFCWSDFITKVLKAYVRREPTSAGGPHPREFLHQTLLGLVLSLRGSHTQTPGISRTGSLALGTSSTSSQSLNRIPPGPCPTLSSRPGPHQPSDAGSVAMTSPLSAVGEPRHFLRAQKYSPSLVLPTILCT